MTIRDYLSSEARRISEKALSDFTDSGAWHRLIPERRRQYREMMCLDVLPPYERRCPLNVKVTGTVERPKYRIEKLYYESLPNVFVTANLYLPKQEGATGSRRQYPGVLYVCGHADTQKVHYQAHPRRFAELGFACLIVDTVQLGEVRGFHHGCYREGWFHWISRGYSPAAIEAINGIRGLDLLAQRSDVNGNKLGVTGISGGGAVTWWIAAADERIKAAASVCGTSTLESYIADRTIDGHCDCMWPTNTYGWDLPDVGALIAPRPLLIASQDRDPLFTIHSVHEVHRQLATLYRRLGAAANLKLVETPGGHAYHEHSRTSIFSWFARHLQGREITPGMIGDIDDSPQMQEPLETLRVYIDGGPPGNRTPTIHDELCALAAPPRITTMDELKQARENVIAGLREKTFAAFPAQPPRLDLKIEYQFADGGTSGARFAFTSEEGWRLRGVSTRSAAVTLPAHVVVALRGQDEPRGDLERFASQIGAPWQKVIFEPRGTGDTAWGQELQWHLRRAAAWTGRTIASMRVWDTLRAIEAARSLPGVDGSRISLAARGEMAAVALYAALLDGRIHSLILESPPATQNASSSKDGRGEAIEMLNCLRTTDLPQIAGLLFPTEIVVAGEFPESYAWAESVYKRLGSPDKFTHIADVRNWRPS